MKPVSVVLLVLGVVAVVESAVIDLLRQKRHQPQVYPRPQGHGLGVQQPISYPGGYNQGGFGGGFNNRPGGFQPGYKQPPVYPNRPGLIRPQQPSISGSQSSSNSQSFNSGGRGGQSGSSSSSSSSSFSSGGGRGGLSGSSSQASSSSNTSGGGRRPGAGAAGSQSSASSNTFSSGK